jgi:ribokinase
MAEPVILVVGSTMVDMIAYADVLPGDGQTVVGNRFATGFGGKGANQAVAAARLGARVAMVNCVGEDAYGADTIRNFEQQGVDARFVRRVPGSSGVAPIWVDARGTNRIICVPAANDATSPELALEAFEALRPAVVVAQFETPQATTAAVFAAARAAGATTVLNPAPAAPIDEAVARATDWLVPNEHEFALLGGGSLDGDPGDEDAKLRALAGRLAVSLVVTLGERGAVVLPHGTSPARVAAPAVTPFDTTGAGDAFVGAFAVGLARGWAPLDAARLGCAFAADSVTRAGTQSSFATTERAAGILAEVGRGTAGAEPAAR